MSRYDGIEAKHKVDEEVQRCAAALRQLSEVEAARVRRIGAFSEQRLRLLDGFGGLLGMHEELRGALEGARGPVAQAASFYHRQMAAVAETMVPAGYAGTLAADDHSGVPGQGMYNSRASAPSAVAAGVQPSLHLGQTGDQVSPPAPFRTVGGQGRSVAQLDAAVQRQTLLVPQGAAVFGGSGYGLVSVHGGLQLRAVAMPASSTPYVRDSRERLVQAGGVSAVVPGSPSAIYQERREFMPREVVGAVREYRPTEL